MHHDHVKMFRKRFWISFAASIPLVLYSDIVTTIFHWNPPAFPGLNLAELALASFIFFYGGWVFLVAAAGELKKRLPGMMTLIAIAIVTAYAWSAYTTFAGRADALFWELGTLITIMLLGHWLEMRAIMEAQGALQELSRLLPDMAEVVVRGNETKMVPRGELKEGDLIRIRPGGKIAADGTIVEGESSIDESLATGESKPVAKRKNDGVIAGTMNGDGALTVKVTNIGERTFLAGVIRLVAEAQSSKSRLQVLADRAARWLTAGAVVAGAITVAAWIAAGSGTAFAIERLVAVLVIACPHALGLAVPLVASIATMQAAKNGFLVKQRLALEAARKIDIVLFDKTGTLTKGEYGVTDMWPVGNANAEEAVRFAASVEAYSEHPAAKAIAAYARSKNIAPQEAKEFVRLPGQGAQAKIGGAVIKVGSRGIIKEEHFAVPTDVAAEEHKGKTIIYVLKEETVVGIFALADIIRNESREAVRRLKAMKVEVAMVTGDAEDVAQWVAGELGITKYFARVLPAEKQEKVKLLQKEGKRVAMVGDGVNDAPALTEADLGIAIGAGTNVAIESAGIVLVKNDPRDIPKILTLSRATYAKMLQNLWWAAGYNILAIPLAAGVLMPEGILLSPAVGAALMTLSTIIVAANAIGLKRKKL